MSYTSNHKKDVADLLAQDDLHPEARKVLYNLLVSWLSPMEYEVYQVMRQMDRPAQNYYIASQAKMTHDQIRGVMSRLQQYGLVEKFDPHYRLTKETE